MPASESIGSSVDLCADLWWSLQHVQAAIRDNRSDRRLKVVLETIEGHSNIPRKRAKFEVKRK